jgi:muramoyltetrapeptide carboxypeptidase
MRFSSIIAFFLKDFFMNIIKPKALKSGDTIGLICPASGPDDLTRIEKSAAYLAKSGYNVLIGKNAFKSSGYLAGTDKERKDDVVSMFTNTDIKAIICIRGGYGSGRLLDMLPYNIIRENPKIIVGFSDITSLQTAFLSQSGIISIAGPMAAVDFYNNPDAYTEEIFRKLVTEPKAFGIIPLPAGHDVRIIKKGIGEGILFGGNLATLTSLVGTPYFPKPDNKILLIEDVDEKPHRIDRMLNQLKLAGVLGKLKGVIAGQFTDCEESDSRKNTFKVEEVLEHYLGNLKVPVITNFPHGHTKHIASLPVGGKVRVNGNKGTVEILESAVKQ